MKIRAVTKEDHKQIAAIYNHYIADSVATFETELVSSTDIKNRIKQVAKRAFPWLVCELDGVVIGYAYADVWKERTAYQHCAEVTAYLAPEASGQGAGTALYDALLNELSNRELKALIAVITLPNESSVKLHEKFGFEKAGHFSEVGRKFDQWLDVGYWQKSLK